MYVQPVCLSSIAVWIVDLSHAKSPDRNSGGIEFVVSAAGVHETAPSISTTRVNKYLMEFTAFKRKWSVTSRSSSAEHESSRNRDSSNCRSKCYLEAYGSKAEPSYRRHECSRSHARRDTRHRDCDTHNRGRNRSSWNSRRGNRSQPDNMAQRRCHCCGSSHLPIQIGRRTWWRESRR